MDYYQAATYLVVLSAVFGFINARWLKLPNTIGLMAITLIFTLILLAISQFDDRLLQQELALVRSINFEKVFLEIMLSFLLFAGSMNTDLPHLKSLRSPIIAFASAGVLISTTLVGLSSYYLFAAFGLSVPLLHCLLFGALISPTDPVAVLGLVRKANAPKKLEIKIVGESLFNDGVGVVIFVTLLGFSDHQLGNTPALAVAELFVREVIGGLLLGAFLGWLCFHAMRKIDSLETEVMLSIAVVMGGTALAGTLGVSAPLAMVVAGLLVGDEYFKKKALSGNSQAYLEKFWHVIDELLNTLLFVLIGMEILQLSFDSRYVYLGLIVIPLLWICRYLSLSIPIAIYAKPHEFVPKTNLIMTWAGLRGGISIALVLSLPENLSRDLLLIITYMVVVTSILLQGLTLAPLIRKLSSN